MPYVAPSTVSAGQTYASASHNIIVNDIIDHESRLLTVQNTQYPYRNVLINGAMQIAQRGTSVSGITSSGSPQTADRWRLDISNAGTWTSAVSADAPTGSGFRNSHRLTCSASAAISSSGYVFMQQKLEGQTLQHIKKGTSSAQQLTLSFWVKGSTTGTYIAQLFDNNNTRSVSAAYTINAADTWEQKAITFPADTTGVFVNDSNDSLDLLLYLAAGTDRTSGTLATSWGASVSANNAVGQTNLASAANRYLAVTGVQLEPGAVASPYEFVLYQDELRRCQRYYYRVSSSASEAYSIFGSGLVTSATQALIPFNTKVTMRSVQPLVESYANLRLDDGGVTVAVTNMVGGNRNENVIELACTSSTLTTGRAAILRANNSTAAFIGISAEL